jgi:hypothetical protein
MVKDIIDGVRALFDTRQELLKGKREKCDKLGTYLEGIGQSLQRVAENARTGQPLNRDLAEIATYADLLRTSVGPELQLMEMDSLVDRLRVVQNIEAVDTEIAADRHTTIRLIDEAAGLFKALGASCRIHTR